MCREHSGLGSDVADASCVVRANNNPYNDSSSEDGGPSEWSPDDDEFIVQPPSPRKSHSEVALDTLISEFTNLLTQHPSVYKDVSLADAAQKLSIPLLEDMVKEFKWSDLESAIRKMEAASRLKYILLDDQSASSPYARLLIEEVIKPMMKLLEDTWSTNFPEQEKLVQFLRNLQPVFPHADDFVQKVVLPGLSDSAARYDLAWQGDAVNVFV